MLSFLISVCCCLLHVNDISTSAVFYIFHGLIEQKQSRMDWLHIIYPLFYPSKGMLFSTASTVIVSAWLSFQHSAVILEIHPLAR